MGTGARNRKEHAMGIDREIDLQFGQGLHCFVISFHSMSWWVVQIPFLGKVWSYGHEGRSCMGWPLLRAQEASKLLGHLGRRDLAVGMTVRQDSSVAA
jgi:hypothetical protein